MLPGEQWMEFGLLRLKTGTEENQDNEASGCTYI